MGEELETLDALARKKTDHICADCGNDIMYTEEVVLLQIVQAEIRQGRALFHIIVDPEDNRNFLFEPYYYCFRCWESLYEKLREETKDEPPMIDSVGPLECLCCSSTIREEEYVATFTLGEFHLSSRTPDGNQRGRYVPAGRPELLCLYCTYTLNLYIEMWPTLSQNGECAECIHARCWRNDACTCGCHNEEAEEYEDIHGC